jgi:DNA-binding response OmpR family regulator
VQLLTRDSLRIVHVDDDNEFAELYAHWLRRAGFIQPIVRCPDGKRALHYFSTIDPQAAPHVILLDLHMPHMTGLEVLHWVRQNYRPQNVAVYLLTSSEDPAHKSHAVLNGVTDYLIKSSRADKLIEKLDCLIAMNNAQSLKASETEHGHSELGNEGLASFGKASSYDTSAEPRDIFNKELER